MNLFYSVVALISAGNVGILCSYLSIILDDLHPKLRLLIFFI